MMSRRFAFRWLLQFSTIFALMLPVGLSACGDDGGDIGVDAGADAGGDIDAVNDPSLPTVDCVTVPSYAEMTVIFYCTGCHSSNNMGGARNGATPGVDYDNYADAVISAERGVRRIYAGTMPPGGNDHIPQEDKDGFYNWALCGTPE